MESSDTYAANQTKFTLKFINKGEVDFTDFKLVIKEYFRQFGLTQVVINKTNSWMLKSNDRNSYVDVELKDKTINITVYNLSQVTKQELENILDLPNIGDYTSKKIPALIKQLDKLLNLKNKEGTVVSLRGSWGVGKTFFWNQYISEKLQESKFVNISLFGVNSLKDIKKQIVLKIYDSNKIHSFLQNNPIIQNIAKERLGIDISLIASNFKKDDFNNIIICFDDFERISPNLSLSEVLGFISELKERHDCKVVLINNNDMLKSQDEINHKKHYRKDKDGNNVEKFFTTQTNNQEIFDKYTEKIIDITLQYEPHLEDSIRFLKIKNLNKQYINWELLEKLFSAIKDDNKKLNIRLIKQVILKLELLKEVLTHDEIEIKLKNGIHISIVKGITNADIDLTYLDIPHTSPASLDLKYKQIINDHYVDITIFKDELIALSAGIKQSEEEAKLYDDIQKTYYKYLYSLSYKDEDFVAEFYNLLNTNKANVVQILGLSNFEFYVNKFLKKLGSDNDKYDELFINKAKIFLENNINTSDNLDMFIREGVDRVLNDYEGLKAYHEKLVKDKAKNNSNSKKNIMKALTEIQSKNGCSKKTEDLLMNINALEHEKWMKEDRNYFELVFSLLDWRDGFAGDKPFIEFYEKTKTIYIKLSKTPQYAYKMGFILERFKISSENTSADDSETNMSNNEI